MASNFLKGKQPKRKRKTPENLDFPGFLSILKLGSALAELRCATCGFEAVLLNAKILNHLKNGAFLRVLAKLSPKLSPASKPASILAF
jgi:hypothetical protein